MSGDLIQIAHELAGWRHGVVDEEEHGVLGLQADPLPDDVVHLTHAQVSGDQVLVLVDALKGSPLGLLYDTLKRKEIFSHKNSYNCIFGISRIH